MIVRGWKNVDGEAAMRDFLWQPPPRTAAIRDLMARLSSGDEFKCRAAANVARRVSARAPGVLRRYANVLIELAFEIPPEQWQARGHLLLTSVLNTATHDQRIRLLPLARLLVENERNALRAIGLEAMAILAAAEPELRDEVSTLLERCRHIGTPAMRSRARRMILSLTPSDNRRRSQN